MQDRYSVGVSERHISNSYDDIAKVGASRKARQGAAHAVKVNLRPATAHSYISKVTFFPVSIRFI